MHPYILMTVVLLTLPSFSQQLSVRLLNAKDGSAAKNLPVWIYRVEAEKAVGKPMQLTTGSDGAASFSLPEGWVKEVYVVSDVSGKVRACSEGTFTLAEFTQGAIAKPNPQTCGAATKFLHKLKVQSNEVILFVRFARWWEQMQR